MKYYLAPMEGVTSYIYRNAYHRWFTPCEKYFTPFITPNQNRTFRSKELRDVFPDHNQGLFIVPQILTNKAEDLLFTSQKMIALGYEEINLNLGCPSKTVVTKKKGSGFLSDPEELHRFLEEVYSKMELKLSIKTRIGVDDPTEFKRLLQIFNEYPVEELVIHPRTQKDFYQNTPNMEVFEEAFANSKNPIIYNGDIFTKEDEERLEKRVPQLEGIMLGRGVIKNPYLIGSIQGKTPSIETLKGFHNEIYQEYQAYLSGEKNVLFKMKELWSYMISLFEDSEKIGKKIRKSQRLKEYEEIIEELFNRTTLLDF